MNLKHTIRKKLREHEEEKKGVDDLIEKYVDKYFRIDFDYSPIPRLETVRTRVYNITIKLYPKIVGKNSIEIDPIVFYATWVVGNGTVTCYDTNSAYTKHGIFRKMSLEKEFEKWLYNKTKEFAKELQ